MVDFAGKSGFIWWIGIVEDRMDPIKLGRCRVRCYGWHSPNKMEQSTDKLPWAMPSIPVNSSTVSTPKEGDMVFGFFLDGENAQEPVMLGVIPGIPLQEANPQYAFSDPRTDEQLKSAPRKPRSKIYIEDGLGAVVAEDEFAPRNPQFLDEPTTSRLARNDSDTIKKTFIEARKQTRVTGVRTVSGTWDEPETKYNAKYPYNRVMETESGHITEFDDTPGAERIHTAHRSGSFAELFPDGDKVEKITKNNYEIIMGDDRLYVMGKVQITVNGTAEFYVRKNALIKCDGSLAIGAAGSVGITSGGNVNIEANGNVNVKGRKISLN